MDLRARKDGTSRFGTFRAESQADRDKEPKRSGGSTSAHAGLVSKLCALGFFMILQGNLWFDGVVRTAVHGPVNLR
ncbi:MAG: hypothetical protein L6Q76_28225, partial [Polyangiaceae bacterium]|nr:hypothetical protein [Polyangiaceae bacterium]